MFVYLYEVLPEVKFPFPSSRGRAVRIIGLFVLQYLTGFLMGKFSGNPAAAVFVR